MKRILMLGVAAAFVAGAAQAQMPTLTHEYAQPGGGSDVSAKNLAEIAAAGKIATIQIQGGKTLTRSIQQVAEGKTDIAAMPIVLHFLMSRGLGALWLARPEARQGAGFEPSPSLSLSRHQGLLPDRLCQHRHR